VFGSLLAYWLWLVRQRRALARRGERERRARDEEAAA